MTHTVTKITCSDCKQEFTGVLHNLFNVSENYAAECPECKGMTFFYGVADFVNVDIPVGAVEIKYVAKL
ncbi:hypothetical protein [Pseudoalteromonas sp. SWXJZ10B]|uniref:hypothetical protein n=1 Tax=Pseudoalteromonas sp. SWXJZ10B TaxID=2792063 RepID=UPI0018CCE948|nr:hypothetical protein [Pseudoalteromonas sp. SWXJZ10B]MBH0041429.1 hypothetical protein [Pseudoalteromonas sp. SWXJZ10B]